MRIYSESTPRQYLGIALLFLISLPAWAQDSPMSSQAAADNSKINQQDRQKSEPTADQQKNNASDVALTRDIRRSLMADKALSTYAHNVKIIAENGKITLKGPVRSDDEKNTVLAKAASVAGQANINDEMTVAPKHN
jgi:hyperosmotically inducible protein